MEYIFLHICNKVKQKMLLHDHFSHASFFQTSIFFFLTVLHMHVKVITSAFYLHIYIFNFLGIFYGHKQPVEVLDQEVKISNSVIYWKTNGSLGSKVLCPLFSRGLRRKQEWLFLPVSTHTSLCAVFLSLQLFLMEKK